MSTSAGTSVGTGRRGSRDQEADRLERAQQVAVFRFQLISPVIDEDLSSRQRGRLVREIASAWHVDPFGHKVRYSRDTVDRWVRSWREGGFAALVPSTRLTPIRTDPAILELAAALKRENPERTAAQVERILIKSQGWSPSQSTLLRLFTRLDLPAPAGDQPVVHGRFEADVPNELWTGDALHGRRVGGRKTYLFAFIDDHSRLITGYRWGFAEDTVRLAAALRPALAARGVPGSVYVDNGSAFVDAWLSRACAKLGIRLVHSTPRRPQGRGKIERWFSTVNDQFLVEVADTTAQDLDRAGRSQAQALLDLNELFTAWVERVYHPRVHSETDSTPIARWAQGWTTGRGPRIPTPGELAEAFSWSQFRSVHARTATVSLLANTYQVDPALTGRRVELVFDPFDLTRIHVRHQGKAYPDAVPHVIGRHAHPKARPETSTTAPPPPTGINYLELIAAEHHEHTAAGINFHALTGLSPDPASPPAATTTDPATTNPATVKPAAPQPIPTVDEHGSGQPDLDEHGSGQPGQVPGQLPLPGMPPDPQQSTDPDDMTVR